MKPSQSGPKLPYILKVVVPQFVIIFVLLLGFGMNYYKFEVIYDHMNSLTPYPMFPWSEHPVESKSDLSWLAAHLFISLLNVFLTGFLYLTSDVSELRDPQKGISSLPEEGCCTRWLYGLHVVIHWAFSWMILTNLHKFGSLSPLMASVVNGIPLAMAIFTFSMPRDNKYRLLSYFLVITFPILVESGFYVGSRMF